MNYRTIIISAILFSVCVVGGCRDESESVDDGIKFGDDAERKAEEAAAERVRDSLRDLAAKHQARLDWQRALTPRGEFRNIYTLDLQDALITDPPQTVVFVASLLDVARRQNGYLTTFSFYHIEDLPDGDEFEYAVVLVLTCEAPAAARLTEKSTAGAASLDMFRRVGRLTHRLGGGPIFDEYDFVVAATISNVFRPTLAIIGSAWGDAEFDPEVTLELDSGATFVAHGACVELVPVSELLEGK